MSVACEDDIIEQIVYLYLVSPYDSLRQSFSDVLQTWKGTRAGKKAAYIVLSVFDRLEMISDGSPLATTSYLQEKFTEYYQCLVQEYQEEQIKSVDLWIKMILWKLQAQKEESVIEDACTMLSYSSAWQVRLAAVNALGELGANQPEVHQALFHALSDSDEDVREAAVSALGKLGANQPDVCKALFHALSDSDEDVWEAAVSALGKLGANQPEVRQVLLQALTDSYTLIRQAAALALGDLGANQPDVCQALLQALSDPQKNVRWAAASALGDLGANQPEVHQTLLQALTDSREDVRWRAASALGKLGAKEPNVLDALLHTLSDPDEDVRQATASALGELGAKEPNVLDALLSTLLEDPSWSVQRVAARILASFPIDRPSIGKRIEERLKERDPLSSNQFEADASVDALWFALQQVIGEV